MALLQVTDFTMMDMFATVFCSGAVVGEEFRQCGCAVAFISRCYHGSKTIMMDKLAVAFLVLALLLVEDL